MFDRLSLVMVVVSDMRRSIDFYQDVLGLKLRMESSDWSEFDLGPTTLALHIAGPYLQVNPKGGISFGFYVDNIDKTLSELTERGATVIHRGDEDFGTLAIIADPDGYPVQVCQLK